MDSPQPSTPEERRREVLGELRFLRNALGRTLGDDGCRMLAARVREALPGLRSHLTSHGLDRAIYVLRTARLFAESIDPDRNILLALILEPFVADGAMSEEEVSERWGEDVTRL